MNIGQVAPALFSADASGTGFAAGSALTVRADGGRTEQPLAQVDTASGKIVAQPVEINNASDRVYLTLYGTGIRNRAYLENVEVKIGGTKAQVEYAGAQGYFAGLDQINILVPNTLKGRGAVNVELSVNGVLANFATVMFK